jgi:hypothetical protein
MPPLRLAILEDVAAHPGATTPEVRRRLNKPRNTVDRQLQALHMLGALACDEIADPDRNRSSWHYYVSDGVEPATLRVPDLSPHIHVNTGYVVGDISGTGVIQ